jgi:hypothetical protein
MTAAVAGSILIAGCKATENPAASNTGGKDAPGPAANNKATDNTAAATVKTDSNDSKPASTDKSACLKSAISGKKLIASQTFVFDHAPFKGACFVTFANPDDMVDEKDVPRGSTFHIFKDGKKIFDFPDAFAGTEACWIEAVGFEDLNGDGKTDVVIAGSCLAARDSYPQNAVFANDGAKFLTREEANELLSEAKTVKAISAIVKKNLAKFF